MARLLWCVLDNAATGHLSEQFDPSHGFKAFPGERDIIFAVTNDSDDARSHFMGFNALKRHDAAHNETGSVAISTLFAVSMTAQSADNQLNDTVEELTIEQERSLVDDE